MLKAGMSDREMRRLFDQVEKEERLEKLSVSYGETMKELKDLKRRISDLKEQENYSSVHGDWISYEADMSPNRLADMYYAEMVGGARP